MSEKPAEFPPCAGNRRVGTAHHRAACLLLSPIVSPAAVGSAHPTASEPRAQRGRWVADARRREDNACGSTGHLLDRPPPTSHAK